MLFSHSSSKTLTSSSRSRSLNLILLSFSIFSIIYLLVSIVLVPTSKFVNTNLLQDLSTPTSLEHVVFGIASNKRSWPKRKEFVRFWWKPQQMRGCVFLESMPPNAASYNDSDSLPPVCISEETNNFRYTYRGGLRSAIRVARVVLETVALNHTNVRWFVFGDDDTVFFPENLLKTLSKYDHNLWHYIGTNSEYYLQNKFFSFDMAFGGAGFAISYPLARVLANVFDSCLERYPHLYGSDARIHSCVAELGIGLTREPGFHQMDIHGDMFGLLAAHPMAPLVSIHHLDVTDPIFPNMTTTKALEHLFEASKVDPHRLLQQTVCYDRWFSWTASVSWGYAVQVFDKHVRLPDVLTPQETFKPWRNGRPMFSFNTKEQHPDPCRRPVVYFLDRVSSGSNGIKSSYRRMVPDNCTIDMISPRKIKKVEVFSQKMDLNIKQLQAPRRHCCDILPTTVGNEMEITIRECKDDELIHMN
ncbi:uncharacterized protein LOC132308018 [Cornus florida]|uniref:uncharacterized protein LOC132308018 n=1 Tax=Cornus florida TaxID=4283 RepID=UPI00289C0789|nr:uncharacterized protein LOC132308018 [Cornus florida]